MIQTLRGSSALIYWKYLKNCLYLIKLWLKNTPWFFQAAQCNYVLPWLIFCLALTRSWKKVATLCKLRHFFPQWDLVFWQKKCQYYLFSLFATLLRLSTPLSLYRTHPTKKMTCTHKSSVRPIFLQTIGEDAFISDFEAKSIWSFCYWSKRSIGLWKNSFFPIYLRNSLHLCTIYKEVEYIATVFHFKMN